MKTHKLKVTSVTLKLGQGDQYNPNEGYQQTKFCDPSSCSSQNYRGNTCIIFMMNSKKLTSVTLKVGQGDPCTIPSRFSMRDNYTQNLMIPAHLLDKLSR